MVPVIKFTFLCSGGNLTLILSGRFAACLYKIILYRCFGFVSCYFVHKIQSNNTAHCTPGP